MVPTLALVTTIVVGLLVGVEAAVAFVLHPILVRLPAGASLAGRADGGRMLGRAMPPWYIASVVLTAAFGILAWGTPTGTYALVAAALLTLSVLASAFLLVPINNRSRAWTATNHPPDWRDQQRRWDRLHYGRVTIILAAFVLIVVGATSR